MRKFHSLSILGAVAIGIGAIGAGFGGLIDKVVKQRQCSVFFIHAFFCRSVMRIAEP